MEVRTIATMSWPSDANLQATARPRAARCLSPADRLDKPMAGFWQSRFDRLEELLRRMDQ
jgi:hypothetical protein